MSLCLAVFKMLSLVTAPVASAAWEMTGPVMVTLAETTTVRVTGRKAGFTTTSKTSAPTSAGFR